MGTFCIGDESIRDSATNFKGYSIIQSKNIEAVISLLSDHPSLALGSDAYSMEIFELPKKLSGILLLRRTNAPGIY